MPRGGKRPGAGAPKGNLNALTNGERSAQVAAVRALLSTPTVRRVIRQLRRRQRRRDQALNTLVREIVRDHLQRTIEQNGLDADSEEA